MELIVSREPYIAMIGDIKQSKNIKNRGEVQRKLQRILSEINGKYESDIASKFVITLGDEFQGLLLSGYNTMKILTEIERKIYPVQLRFGIGIGDVTTDINKEMSIGADGPAYYKAREAIDYIKSNEKKKLAVPTDVRVEADDDKKNTTYLLNTILSLMMGIKSSWSNRQREIIWDMLEHQDSQSAVASRFQIKQPAIQKSLALGNYYGFKEAMVSMDKALGEIRRD
jgi:hypothetical protein